MNRFSLALFPILLAFAACTSESAADGVDGQALAGEPAKADKTEKADKAAASGAGNAEVAAAGIYAMEATALDGNKVSLADYKGKVTLVVNVASECGYTPQYTGLQKLHSEMAAKGFAVLGFPSNEFGGQEPGTSEQIREFCTSKFGVEFPMFAKVETKEGDGQSPIYAALQKATGKQPKWNFCKYLVGKDGTPIAFYASGVKPESGELRQAIEAALE